MWKYVFIVLLMFAMPALADNRNIQIRVDKAACRYVTKHIPDADVEYKPCKVMRDKKTGEEMTSSCVDARGKKIVPADLTPPTDYHVEDSMYLRLTLDAAKTFGLKVPNIPTIKQGNNPNVPAVMSETVAGYITFKHGKAYLNGRPLDDVGQSQLAVLCKAQKTE